MFAMVTFAEAAPATKGSAMKPAAAPPASVRTTDSSPSSASSLAAESCKLALVLPAGMTSAAAPEAPASEPAEKPAPERV
jgi:hypothetical protein